jgi:hypothetical protein
VLGALGYLATSVGRVRRQQAQPESASARVSP